MSRSENSIFDSTEEAALTLTLVAKGMINVDDFPEKMRSGTSKVILEVSGCILLESQNEEISEESKGKIIHQTFRKPGKHRKKEEVENGKVGEPGA